MRASELGAGESDVRSDTVSRSSRHHKRLLECVPRLAVRATRRAQSIRAAAHQGRSDLLLEENALALVPFVCAAQRVARAHQTHHDVSRRAHSHRSDSQRLQAAQARPLGGDPQVLFGHKRRRASATL